MSIPCRKAFTSTLLKIGLENKKIMAATSDARGSATLGDYANTLPNQFVEIGIAEQNLVGISAGLSTCGYNVFAVSPASFLSARSLEQIKMDVAYSNTNVKLIGISGGVSYGALGASHHSLQDLAVMRAISGLTVLLPCDACQTAKFTEMLASFEGPVYLRIGRNAVPDVYPEGTSFEFGKAVCIHSGNDITLIASGEMVYHAKEAALKLEKQGIWARVLDMHTIKPLDEAAIIDAARQTGHIITVEEHSIYGGLGSAVSQVVSGNCPVPVKVLGIPDEPVVTGTSLEVFGYYHMDSDGIAGYAIEMLKKNRG